MGFFENRRKKKLERAQELSEEAEDIMRSTESTYVGTEREMAQCDKNMELNASKAKKHAEKAYISASDEASAVNTFNKAQEILSAQGRLEDRKVRKATDAYYKSIGTGNLKKAQKYAFALLTMASSQPNPIVVRASLDDSTLGDGVLNIIVTNKDAAPIIIDSVHCASGTKTLLEEDSMSVSVPAGAMITRKVEFDPEGSFNLIVTVMYESGFDKLKLSKSFPIRSEAE